MKLIIQTEVRSEEDCLLIIRQIERAMKELKTNYFSYLGCTVIFTGETIQDSETVVQANITRLPPFLAGEGVEGTIHFDIIHEAEIDQEVGAILRILHTLRHNITVGIEYN